MKRYLFLVLALAVVFSTAFANEVSYVEWDKSTGGAYLNLTVKASTKKLMMECRVEYKGRPVSSGSAVTSAGVAVVSIRMPSEFQNKSIEFAYFCQEGSI